MKELRPTMVKMEIFRYDTGIHCDQFEYRWKGILPHDIHVSKDRNYKTPRLAYNACRRWAQKEGFVITDYINKY